MNPTVSSDLEKLNKEELIQEIIRLRSAVPEQSDSAESGNGKFSEDELIALGSPRAGDEMYLATDTGRIIYANDRFADELAYLPHEIMERTIPEVDTKHSRAKWLHFVSSLKKAGKPLTFET